MGRKSGPMVQSARPLCSAVEGTHVGRVVAAGTSPRPPAWECCSEDEPWSGWPGRPAEACVQELLETEILLLKGSPCVSRSLSPSSEAGIGKVPGSGSSCWTPSWDRILVVSLPGAHSVTRTLVLPSAI